MPTSIMVEAFALALTSKVPLLGTMIAMETIVLEGSFPLFYAFYITRRKSPLVPFHLLLTILGKSKRGALPPLAPQ